jgi:hypothetical protein
VSRSIAGLGEHSCLFEMEANKFRQFFFVFYDEDERFRFSAHVGGSDRRTRMSGSDVVSMFEAAIFYKWFFVKTVFRELNRILCAASQLPDLRRE